MGEDDGGSLEGCDVENGDEEVDDGEESNEGNDDGGRLGRFDVGNGDEEVDDSEKANEGNDDGDSLERCGVVDGGNKHTCGRAGKLVQLKKVGHSSRCIR